MSDKKLSSVGVIVVVVVRAGGTTAGAIKPWGVNSVEHDREGSALM